MLYLKAQSLTSNQDVVVVSSSEVAPLGTNYANVITWALSYLFLFDKKLKLSSPRFGISVHPLSFLVMIQISSFLSNLNSGLISQIFCNYNSVVDQLACLRV